MCVCVCVYVAYFIDCVCMSAFVVILSSTVCKFTCVGDFCKFSTLNGVQLLLNLGEPTSFLCASYLDSRRHVVFSQEWKVKAEHNHQGELFSALRLWSLSLSL